MLLYARYATTAETTIVFHSSDTLVLFLSAVHFDMKLIGYELFLYTKSPEHWAKKGVTLFHKKNEITRSRRDDSYLVHLAYG